MEELEISEMTTEALNAIMQRPSTRKYRSHVMKHTANILEKFGKILDAERSAPDPNKVLFRFIVFGNKIIFYFFLTGYRQ